MAKTSFDESDISLGHINALFIAPPHTAGSLKACIVKVEGLVTPGHALYKDMELFQDTVECRASGSCCQSFIQMKNRIVTSYLNKDLQSSLMSSAQHHSKGLHATMAKRQLNSNLHSYPCKPLHSQGHSKLNVRKVDSFCSLKRQTLQSFVVQKSEHYKVL